MASFKQNNRYKLQVSLQILLSIGEESFFDADFEYVNQQVRMLFLQHADHETVIHQNLQSCIQNNNQVTAESHKIFKICHSSD